VLPLMALTTPTRLAAALGGGVSCGPPVDIARPDAVPCRAKAPAMQTDKTAITVFFTLIRPIVNLHSQTAENVGFTKFYQARRKFTKHERV
jgi:hypothetical protein